MPPYQTRARTVRWILSRWFRNWSTSPIKIGVPIAPPLTLEALKNAAAAAPASNYLAILGPDALGANRLDGFGIELEARQRANLRGGIATAGGQYPVDSVHPGLGRTNLPAGDEGWDLRSRPCFDRGFRRRRPVRSGWRPGGDRAARQDTPRGGSGKAPAEAAAERRSPVHGAGGRGAGGARLLRRAARPAFQHRLVPAEVRFQTEVAMAYVQGAGLQSEGGGAGLPPLATEFTVPLNLRAGSSGAGVSIERVLVRIEAKPEDDTLQIPRCAPLRRQGRIRPGADRRRRHGRLVWQLGWYGGGGIETPTMIGVSLDAGPVSGGGFLAKVGENEYAGGLSP